MDALPTTFLIDREGKIAAVHVGLASKKDFEDGIEQLLQAPAPVTSGRLLLCRRCWRKVADYLTVGEPQKVAGKRGAAVQAKIPVTVMSGFHVNSNTPSEEYLIPLKLTWTATGALEGGQSIIPSRRRRSTSSREKPLSVYTGNFDLMANFKVAANAPAGPGVAAGKLRTRRAATRPASPEDRRSHPAVLSSITHLPRIHTDAHR